MHARVVLGVGKGVPFREVSSVQECPYREYISLVVVFAVVKVCCLYLQDCPVGFRESLVFPKVRHLFDTFELFDDLFHPSPTTESPIYQSLITQHTRFIIRKISLSF